MAAKGKGSSYEREICRLLSLWWTEGVSDDYFWRTAGSGAMAKTRSKVGKKTHGHYGDIQAVHPDGEPLIRVCLFELKRGYKNWSPLDVIDKGKRSATQTLEKFFAQMDEDKANGDIPYSALVFRRDKRQSCIGIETQLYRNIDTYQMGNGPIPQLRLITETHDFIFLNLEDFLGWANPKYFVEKYNDLTTCSQRTGKNSRKPVLKRKGKED